MIQSHEVDHPQGLSGQQIRFRYFGGVGGLLGLATLRQYRANVVFLDFNMPRVNGFEALGEIQKCYPAVGVVMISTSG